MDVQTATVEEMVGTVEGSSDITVNHENLLDCLPFGLFADTGETINGLPLKRHGLHFTLSRKGEIVACLRLASDGGHCLWVAESERGQNIAAQLVANAIWCGWVTGWGHEGKIIQWDYLAPDQFSLGGRPSWTKGVKLFKSWL